MSGTDTRKGFKLTLASDSGCGCCSIDSTAMVFAPSDSPGAAATRYGVEGLTCGHCLESVQSAVSAVAGVESATVELVAGGISTLSVFGDARLASVQAAVENAGYTLVGN